MQPLSNLPSSHLFGLRLFGEEMVKGGTEEVMQPLSNLPARHHLSGSRNRSPPAGSCKPCLIHLHLISLVAQVTTGLSAGLSIARVIKTEQELEVMRVARSVQL